MFYAEPFWAAESYPLLLSARSLVLCAGAILDDTLHAFNRVNRFNHLRYLFSASTLAIAKVSEIDAPCVPPLCPCEDRRCNKM
jgi:hypothetical protein